MGRIDWKTFDKSIIYKYYIEENLSYDEASKQIGISPSQVRRLCNKYGFVKDKSDVISSREKTNIKKYGCENPFGNKEVQKKIVETNRKKYGVDYAINNPVVKEKAISTLKSNYGCENYNYVNIEDWVLELINSPEKMREFVVSKNIKSPMELKYALGFNGECTIYRIINRTGINDLMDSFTSCYEAEFSELLKSWGVRCFKTKKEISPYEIDLYCPDYKIGIEINGNLYHSFVGDGAPHCDGKDEFYHARKSKLAENKGIFLFHIFEYELLDDNKKEVIISQLRNLFMKNNRKIYARECVVKEVSPKEKANFLFENHRQKNDNSSVRLGLYYKEELVSLMTFGKPRFNKNYKWELLRFCSKADTTVVGGASKLFKYFLNNYEGNIISYSDNAKTRGNLYKILGFSLLRYSDPNYVWCNSSNNIKTRYQCQMKDEVKKMRELGYWRIYDCGNKVWSFDR